MPFKIHDGACLSGEEHHRASTIMHIASEMLTSNVVKARNNEIDDVKAIKYKYSMKVLFL